MPELPCQSQTLFTGWQNNRPCRLQETGRLRIEGIHASEPHRQHRGPAQACSDCVDCSVAGPSPCQPPATVLRSTSKHSMRAGDCLSRTSEALGHHLAKLPAKSRRILLQSGELPTAPATRSSPPQSPLPSYRLRPANSTLQGTSIFLTSSPHSPPSAARSRYLSCSAEQAKLELELLTCPIRPVSLYSLTCETNIFICFASFSLAFADFKESSCDRRRSISCDMLHGKTCTVAPAYSKPLSRPPDTGGPCCPDARAAESQWSNEAAALETR